MGEYLSIDETALSKGELYTIITNKKYKGQKGSLVAVIKGTQSEYIIEIIKKISINLRQKVKEITLDMAGSMKNIVSACFPLAIQVTDRFHVQKLAIEAVQSIRIKFRWAAIDEENTLINQAKKQAKKYSPKLFSNGDTAKQLLARSRYILYKSKSKWTLNQSIRANILFEHYPEIDQAYKLSEQLKQIYNNKNKGVATLKLARWYNEIEKMGIKEFNTVMNSLKINNRTILNYFDNRSTNASAESFNAKVKAFRAQFRGVRNPEYFLFRLAKIFA